MEVRRGRRVCPRGLRRKETRSRGGLSGVDCSSSARKCTAHPAGGRTPLLHLVFPLTSHVFRRDGDLQIACPAALLLGSPASGDATPLLPFNLDLG